MIPFTVLAYLVLSLLIAIQQLGRQASIALLSLATIGESATFILLIVPAISLITLPMAILLGSLIALNRLKADSEMTAARSCGLSPFATNLPFAIVGLTGAAIAMTLTLNVIPRTLQKMTHFRALVLARGLVGQVKPQTFESRFPDHLLYVHDIDSRTGDWLGVVLVRQTKDKDALLLTARRGQLRIVETPELALEIKLSQGVSLIASDDANHNTIASFDDSFLRLTAQRDLGSMDALSPAIQIQALNNAGLRDFIRNATGAERTIALIEWHKRRAVPLACIVLALIAIVIGLLAQKARSRAIGIALGFSIAVAYYLCLTAGQNLAQSGIVPPWAGIWAANAIGLLFAVVGRYLRRAISLATFTPAPVGLPSLSKPTFSPARKIEGFSQSLPRLSNLINYLLVNEILRIFVLGAGVLVATTLVFTLFDLIPSIARSRASLTYVATYFVFLTPQIFYYTAPFALLIATLTAYFILSRTNQLVILSASGLSLVRLAFPIAFLAVLVGGLLFSISDALLPYTNREQDWRYHQIKGKKLEQAAFALGQQWAYGARNQIFAFHYSDVDKQLLNTYVYQLTPDTQLLDSVTYIKAARAQAASSWQVDSGWRYGLRDGKYAAPPEMFKPGEIVDLGEDAQTFRRTINESSKLSFAELRSYIASVKRIGAPTYSEQIDLWRRLSHPLSALTLIALAMPWVIARRFQSRRETMAGVGIGVVISILYWLATQGFEIAGKNALLPVSIAVWGAHVTSWSLAVYMWGRRLTH